MKVVLDTNVVVSGLIKEKGTCAQILRMVFGGHLDFCVDDRILQEYEAVLHRPFFRMLPEDVSNILALIRFKAERIIPASLRVEIPDRSDLPFLEAAAAANAILVTGNARHFPRHERAGVIVMTPREFLDFLRGS
ncbi:MAG: putative toxin-antitoxin system toxin component, PIN family [Candidatus Brocadiia bacterium]|jgi:putative PIN family toxin of toxin-antitoxin system